MPPTAERAAVLRRVGPLRGIHYDEPYSPVPVASVTSLTPMLRIALMLGSGRPLTLFDVSPFADRGTVGVAVRACSAVSGVISPVGIRGLEYEDADESLPVADRAARQTGEAAAAQSLPELLDRVRRVGADRPGAAGR